MIQILKLSQAPQIWSVCWTKESLSKVQHPDLEDMACPQPTFHIILEKLHLPPTTLSHIPHLFHQLRRGVAPFRSLHCFREQWPNGFKHLGHVPRWITLSILISIPKKGKTPKVSPSPPSQQIESAPALRGSTWYWTKKTRLHGNLSWTNAEKSKKTSLAISSTGTCSQNQQFKASFGVTPNCLGYKVYWFPDVSC